MLQPGHYVLRQPIPCSSVSRQSSDLNDNRVLMHISDPRVLGQRKEGVLHWAGMSPQESKELVKLILGVEGK